MRITETQTRDYDPAQYPPAFVTADIVIFTLRQRQLQILLIERKEEPFAGCWAIPGGFVRPTETLEQAAQRELQEETGVTHVFLEQLHAFGDPGRDPRTRIVTIAFTALIPSDRQILKADTDAAQAKWFALDDLPQPLAFDHTQIIDHALQNLRRRLETSNIAQGLLPSRFTLTQLQEVYETLLAHTVDKRNFRKWIMTLGLVQPTDQEVRGHHRPALLYEFISPNDDRATDDASRFLWNRRVRRRQE